MKRILLALCLLAPLPVIETGCQSSQVVTAQRSLYSLGQLVDTSMSGAAKAYHNGTISEAQWQKIADLHDKNFLPPYNEAVKLVLSDLTQPAPAQLVSLALDLTALIASTLANK